MASIAGLGSITLPQLSGMEEEDARQLRNYLYQMSEQLQYILMNLDRENMTQDFLNRMKKEETR